MKKILFVLFLCVPVFGFNQITLEWNSDESRLAPVKNKKQIFINYTKDGTLQVHAIRVEEDGKITACEDAGNLDDPLIVLLKNDDVDIKYEIDCQEQTVEFYTQEDKTDITEYQYCDSKKTFIPEGGDCIDTDQVEDETNGNYYGGNERKEFNHITDIPIPYFEATNQDELLYHRTNRYLFVDAHSDPFSKRNNSLYKRKKNAPAAVGEDRKIEKQFKKAHSIPVNGSVSIFIRKLSFHDLENLSVSISGIDYSFDKDVSYLITQLNGTNQEKPKGGEDIVDDKDGEAASLEKKDTDNPQQSYLQTVKDFFDEIDYLNVNDLYVVEAFKETLRSTIENEENEIELSDEEHILYSYILSWYPEYTSITPIAMTTPDNDEVDIEVSIKNKSDSSPKVYKVGTYKTSRALSVAVGGMVFITDLKNNNVFTQSFKDSTGVVDSIMARIDTTKTSIGIGMNSELMFRTGSWFRPSLNLGFFVPFEEELSPFLTFGPGISIINKKVKFSISTGLTYGKVNDIVPRYKNQNLVDVENLTNENITEKVWKRSWYYNLGISFNISED